MQMNTPHLNFCDNLGSYKFIFKNYGQYLPRTYSVSGSMTKSVLHLILITTLGNYCYDYHHFIERKNAAQKG